MTVLQVCAYAAPYEGNFIKSLRVLEKELKSLGHKTIYAFPENAKELDWIQELAKESKVYFLPLAKARIKPQTYHDLRKIYKDNEDIKVIHSHFELYDVPVSMTAPKGVKVFWHLHDAIEIYNSLRYRVIHKIQYAYLHGRAVLLSVSQRHMEYVLRCGFPKEQAIYLPNGIDTDRIKRVSTDPQKRQYDFLIFGWELDRKGVDLCIEAIRQLNNQCSVAVVGADNTNDLIHERFGEVPQIHVVKPVKDINQLYSDAKCFLHISRAEGLSYALLEAVYSGLPVICSDIPENQFAEVFQTVTMVKNESVLSISAAMKKQIERNSIDESSVNQVCAVIENRYSISCWVKNILIQYGL